MRFARRKTKPFRSASPDQINIGFMPTIDSTVLIVAKELGLFERRGLTVRLTREVGWATVREKLLHEELDAAAAHASMLYSIYAGVGGVRRRCLTGLLMGLSGSAITLSNEIREQGAHDAKSFGELARKHKGQRTFTLGMVLAHSSQNYYLRQWLRQGGLDPDEDVRTVVIPSNLVYETFREGQLDGFCVADPWNSMAAFEGTGWVVSATSEFGQHPEKVLLVLSGFAEEREEEHLMLIAALIEASVFSDQPENRREVVRMLAQKKYFDVPPEYLANSLIGPFNCGHTVRDIPDFVQFDCRKFGNPSRARGKWVLDMVQSLSPAGPLADLNSDTVPRVFREDIYQQALRRFEASAGGDPELGRPDAAPAVAPIRKPPSMLDGLAEALRVGSALARKANPFSEAPLLH